MKKIDVQKLFYVMMIWMLLFWSFFPAVSHAFISPGSSFAPGQAITPGQSITPGTPISGGKFIVPGEVYQPGKAYTPGKAYNDGSTINGGAPILKNFPLTNGTFIIPNAPPPPPNFTFVGISFEPGDPGAPGSPAQAGNGIEGGNTDGNGKAAEGGNTDSNGNPINGGNTSEGGNAEGGGNAIEGGNAMEGGSPSEGGNPNNLGTPAEGGDPASVGDASGNGGPMNGGDSGTAGNTPSTGEPGSGSGNSASSGEGPTGGQSPDGGTSSQGGDGSSGSASEGNGRSGEESLLAGILGTGIATLKDVKRWGTDVLFGIDDIVQGTIAHQAGYKFIKDGDKNYKFQGNRKAGNKVSQWFLNRYSKDINPGKRNFNNFQMKEFLDGKKLGGITASLKKSIRDKFVPFYKKTEEIKRKGYMKPQYVTKWAFNKNIMKPMQLIKGSAPVNFVLTTGQTFVDYTVGAKKSLFNTPDFYADLSTDLTIGAGTTLLGSMAGAAAAGAVGGSAVPGLGTVAGAAAGLIVGGLSYFALHTKTGQKVKKAIRSGFKKTYTAVGNAAGKVKEKFNDMGSKLKSGLGGIFG